MGMRSRCIGGWSSGRCIRFYRKQPTGVRLVAVAIFGIENLADTGQGRFVICAGRTSQDRILLLRQFVIVNWLCWLGRGAVLLFLRLFM